MSFLSIAFLFALPLAAAPLLLHFFDRRRNNVIQWGAMQFLMEASAKKTSARRIKQWLLLLLRCLAIASLVFALARPLLPGGYLGGNQRGETIFIVDNSMSMSRSTDTGTMISDASAKSIQRLSELSARDDVRVMTTSPYPVWLDSGGIRGDRRNREWMENQLSEVTSTRGRSDLLAALFAAVQAELQPTQSSRRIVVMTDGQAADWRLDDEAGWQQFTRVLNESPVRTEIETVRLDQRNPTARRGNVGIDQVAIDRTIVGVGQTVTAFATLHNYDEDDVDAMTLSWKIRGESIDEQSTDPIPGGQTVQSQCRHTFDSVGTYQLTCQIDHPDDLIADNQASLVVEVVDRVPIVIVEDRFEFAEMQQDSYFVQAALGWIDGEALDGKSIYVPTLVSPGELERIDLSNQRVVVIPNLTQLDESAVESLTDFVSDGGGLWIGLGPRTDVDAFNHRLFADASGLSPVQIDRIVDSGGTGDDATDVDTEAPSARTTRIDPFRSEHPAMRQLADDSQLDLSDAVIRRRFEFLRGTDAESLSVLIRLNNGLPLAAENFVGKGRVIVQGVPMRLQWSDLARTQAFVVMVRDWIDYLAQPRATKFNLQPGEPIAMRLPLPEDSVSFEAPTALLITPQGDSIELTAQRRDNAFEYRSSRTRLPGDYRLEVGLAEQVIPFHVQESPEESDLVSLSADASKRLVAATTVDPSQARSDQIASAQSDPVWPYLLIGLIALITAELTLSGVLSRERFGSAGIPEFSELDAAQPGQEESMVLSSSSPVQPSAGAALDAVASEVN